MSEVHFSRTHEFPRETGSEIIRNIFSFVDKRLGTTSDFEEEGANDWLNGVIYKKYDNGLAYAFLSFGIKSGHYASNKSRNYFDATLWANTPLRKVRSLVEKLDAEVAESLKEYFRTH